MRYLVEPQNGMWVAVTDNLLDYDIVKLLEVYAKEKKVDFNKLKSAFELINL